MAAKITGLSLRLLVAAIFLYAGTIKIWDFGQWKSGTPDFFEAVLNYQLLPWDAAMALAIYLPWLEVGTGLALLTQRWCAGGLAITGALTLVFLGALGSAWWRGLDISCGCFGKETNDTDFPVALARDAALLAAIGLAWWSVARGRKRC